MLNGTDRELNFLYKAFAPCSNLRLPTSGVPLYAACFSSSLDACRSPTLPCRSQTRFLSLRSNSLGSSKRDDLGHVLASYLSHYVFLRRSSGSIMALAGLFVRIPFTPALSDLFNFYHLSQPQNAADLGRPASPALREESGSTVGDS